MRGEVGLLPLHQPCHYVRILSVHAHCRVSMLKSRTPETFDIVSTTVDIASRKNLAQISKMLTQITNGAEFSEDSPAYLPVNDYIRKSIASMSAWLMSGM